MKAIDYVCGMNFVSQYQQAIQFPHSCNGRRLIKDVACRDHWNLGSLGPYGPTYDFWGIPYGIWLRRGEKFMRGDYSLGDY